MSLNIALTAVMAVSAGLVVLLIAVKLIHRAIERDRGVRLAHYVAAIGEMVSRRAMPSNSPQGWAQDPLFHDALADYRLLVTGPERTFLDDLGARLGVLEVLVTRSRRRFPVTRRLRAVARLVDLATPHQRAELRRLLFDPNHLVRTHVVRGLARLGDIESIDAILSVARHAEPWEAGRIADALIDLGPDGVPALSRWVENEVATEQPSADLVALVTRVLGLIGDPSAEPTLSDLLESDREEWRLAAASALEHAGGPDSIPQLLIAVDDRSWRVRARAVIALGNVGDAGAARSIAGLLYDNNWWVRQNAATALANVPGGTEFLLAAAEGHDPYAADAALHQLATSGVLAAAAKRLVTGAATTRDRRLASMAAAV